MRVPSRPHLHLALICAVLLSSLSACSTLHPGISDFNRESAPAALPAFDLEAPAVSDVEIDWSPSSMFVLQARRSGEAGAAASARISDLSFSELGVLDAMRLIAAQANLTLRVEGGALTSERFGPVTIERLSGSLTEVLDAVSEAAGVFYELRGNQLIVRQDQQFVVSLPPVLGEDTMAGVSNTLQYLGGRDVYLDRAGRMLTFSANRRGMEGIQQYLEVLRKTRSLLVYDTHLYQVELSDGQQTGINWSSFNMLGSSTVSGALSAGAAAGQVKVGEAVFNALPGSLVSGAVSTTGTVGLGLVTRSLNIASLVNFLNTQGTVSSLSSPQITVLSGSEGRLHVGKTLQYVSRVGASTTTGVSQVTTEVSVLKTGLSLQLRGDVYDQTVWTSLKLAVSDVSEWTPFEAVGVKLNLPQPLDRELDATVRARPGDVVLIGGIHLQSDQDTSKRGVPGFSTDRSRTRSELVLVLRARVIRFVERQSPATAPATAK